MNCTELHILQLREKRYETMEMVKIPTKVKKHVLKTVKQFRIFAVNIGLRTEAHFLQFSMEAG